MRRISAFDIWNGMKIYLNISLRVKNVQSWEFDWKKLKWRRFILISNIHESGRQQRQHSNILDNHLAVAHWTLLFCFPSLFWTSTNLFRNSKLCRRTDFVLLFILFWIFICCQQSSEFNMNKVLFFFLSHRVNVQQRRKAQTTQRSVNHKDKRNEMCWTFVRLICGVALRSHMRVRCARMYICGPCVCVFLFVLRVSFAAMLLFFCCSISFRVKEKATCRIWKTIPFWTCRGVPLPSSL